ncbi:hypothetical protein GCM10022265_07020 [Marinobacter xestospongiae]
MGWRRRFGTGLCLGRDRRQHRHRFGQWTLGNRPGCGLRSIKLELGLHRSRRRTLTGARRRLRPARLGQRRRFGLGLAFRLRFRRGRFVLPTGSIGGSQEQIIQIVSNGAGGIGEAGLAG